MKSVLHIGAESGEFDQYHLMGTKQLLYVEPDIGCLDVLRKNQIKYYEAHGKAMNIDIIPMACSSATGQSVVFYANGSGQSSILKPGQRTIEMVGDNFQKYSVQTISLTDLIQSDFFSGQLIDYLCIDVQGHEELILTNCSINILKERISIIDVELMTDPSQYEIKAGSWKDTCTHLIRAGFEPLVHPLGMTESYLFVNFDNLLLNKSDLKHIIESARDDTMDQLFAESKSSDSRQKPNMYASIFESGFLPLTHVGGVIHCSMIERFRKLVLARYSAFASMQKYLLS